MGRHGWKFIVFYLCYVQIGLAETTPLTVLSRDRLCQRVLRVLASLTQESNGKPPSLDENADADFVLSVIISDLKAKNPGLSEGVESPEDTVTYYAFPDRRLPFFTSFRNDRQRPFAPDTTPKKGAIALSNPQTLSSRVWARSSSAAETLGELSRVKADLAPESHRPVFATVLHGPDAQRFIARLIESSPAEVKEVSTERSSDPRDRYGLWQATVTLVPLRHRAKWLVPVPLAVLSMPYIDSPNLRGVALLGSLALTAIHAGWNARREYLQTRYLDTPDAAGVKPFSPSNRNSQRYPTLLPQDQLGSVLFHAANKARHLGGWRHKLWNQFLPEFKTRNAGDWVMYSQSDPTTGVDLTLLYQFGEDDRLVLVARGDGANPRTLVEQLGVNLEPPSGEPADPGEIEFFRPREKR